MEDPDQEDKGYDLTTDKLGRVYFIRCSLNGLTKIGFTDRHPDIRFSELQRASPVPLMKYGVIRADADLEVSLHQEFSEARTHGEWFRPDEAIEDYIAANAERWPDPRKVRETFFRRVDPSLTMSLDDLCKERDELREENGRLRRDVERLSGCLNELDYLTPARIRRLTPAGMKNDLRMVEAAMKGRCRGEIEEEMARRIVKP